MERLRYSDRKRLAEQGSLGPLEYDNVPHGLRTAVQSVYYHAAWLQPPGLHFDNRVVAACEQHFGRKFFGRGHPELIASVEHFFTVCKLEDFLDLCEILAEEGPRVWTFPGAQRWRAEAEAEEHINAAFVRQRFGYRISKGRFAASAHPRWTRQSSGLPSLPRHDQDGKRRIAATGMR
jgi:hypothetical protein